MNQLELIKVNFADKIIELNKIQNEMAQLQEKAKQIQNDVNDLGIAIKQLEDGNNDTATK